MARASKPRGADRGEQEIDIPRLPDDRSSILDQIPRPEDAPEEGVSNVAALDTGSKRRAARRHGQKGKA